MVMRRTLLSLLPVLALGLGLGCDEENAEPGYLVTVHGAFDPLVHALPGLEGVTEQLVGERRVWLVQFEAHIRPGDRAGLESLGAQIQDYLPHDALIVRATPAVAAGFDALPGVRSVTRQQPLLRIAPALVQRVQDRILPVARLVPTRLMVEVDGPEAQLAVAREVARLGGEVLDVSSSGWLMTVRVTDRDAARLAARTDVDFVSPAPRFRLFNDDARWSVQAGPDRPGETPVTDQGLRGEGQIVAFADSGLDQNSCYFEGSKILEYEDWTGTGEVDEIGHGTHVGGSIAGDRGANGTHDPYDGMAPAALLFVQDVGSNQWGLSGIPADLGQLFGSSFAAGARIHSNSWGSETSAYDSSARSLDRFVAANPEFLVLVANGNSGPGDYTVGSPATAKNVLSVGASRNGTRIDDLTYFSSRGPARDGRIKPTLTAPGYEIGSASAGEACGVVAESGTSMACPTLAGAAALVRQYYTEGFFPSGARTPADGFSPSAALLRATLISGASAMEGEYAGEYPGMAQGFGRANLGASLYFQGDPASQRLWVADSLGGLDAAETTSFDLVLDRVGDLKIALTWTDPAGASSAGQALVNDLDLTVISPGGDLYLGNAFQAGRSATGGVPDSLNVEEIVFVPSAEAGNWTVTVRGANVPDGPQAFALTANGPVLISGQADPTPDPDPVLDPTLEPCADEVFSPDSATVGWVRETDPDVHHIGDDDIYAGVYNDQVHLGLIQFDLGRRHAIDRATLALTGQTTEYLDGGSFEFEIIDLPPLDGSTTYEAVANAPVIETALTFVRWSEVGGWIENVIELPTTAFETSLVTIRIRGTVVGQSVMSWDSGFGTGGIGVAPRLGLCRSGESTIDLRPIGQVMAEEGVPFQIDLELLQSSGDPVTYTADALPQGASLDAVTGAFRWTPGYEDAGQVQVVFSVTDGTDYDEELAIIVVNDVNRAPVFDDTASQNLRIGIPLELEVGVSDPDGDPVDLRVLEAPAGVVLEGTTLQWTPAQIGTFEVGLAATDGLATSLHVLRFEVVGALEVTGPEPSEPADEAGCGCSASSGGGGFVALLLFGGIAARRRRRR